MSIVDRFNGVVGSLTGGRTGEQPTLPSSGPVPGGSSAASSLTSKFNSVFDTTFDSTLADVATRGANGEFDDPTFRLQESAALARLQAARERAAASPTAGATAGPPASVTGGGGASAAPEAQPAPSDGVPADTSGATGVAGDDDTIAAQRELYGIRVRQSEARLQNVSKSLTQEFPAAAKLASASTGTWDPETFVPKTREEAEAFAQRMVIDATESAARLEIVKTQLDAAQFEAQTTGSPAAIALARELEADFERQKEYVDKLAKIVDSASNGAVSDTGADAIDGETARDLNDLPVEEIVAALRASGMDDEAIERVIGAGELAVQEEKTPGGAPVLRQIASDAALWTWQHRERLREARADFERDRAEQRKMDDRRADDRRQERRSERKRLDARAADRRQGERQQREVSAQTRAGEERAKFQTWLHKMEAEARSRGQAT